MDPVGALQLSIFLIGSLAATFVTGLAGFAFGLIAAAIWLYALTPEQTTSLIVAYALLVQGYAVWKLRHTLNATRLIPLIVGSAVGVPIGIVLLRWVPPGWLRVALEFRHPSWFEPAVMSPAAGQLPTPAVPGPG